MEEHGVFLSVPWIYGELELRKGLELVVSKGVKR